jgi:hypothetical protein
MEKQDQKKEKISPDYIPGIFHYCDRWCERCVFCSRCLTCTMAEAEFGDLKESDLSNEAFWQKLTEVLQETYDMIKEMAGKEGIDLDAIDYDDGFDGNRPDSLEHLISHLSKNYQAAVDEWFEACRQRFSLKEVELNWIHVLDPSENPERDAFSINDAVEVLRWYQFQIHVKLKRAIESAAEEERYGDDGFPKDSDGSAKVALIGIDRSLSAWKILLAHFPEEKRAILDLMASLKSLKKRTESQFPAAWDFIRPGFDEVRAEPVKGDRQQ